jgi:hypothetical protein
MNEQQWQIASDPRPMLQFLQASGTSSDRKLRLFAVACVRGLWRLIADERSRAAVCAAEEYADGKAGAEELARAQDMAGVAVRDADAEAGREWQTNVWAAWFASMTVAAGDSGGAAWQAVEAMVREPGPASWPQVKRHHCDVLRDLFGPLPFRPVTISPSVRTWNDGTVLKLATAAYEDRVLPAGTFRPDRVAVLADALEEAGCQVPAVLTHLREPASHWRGCWVLDLLLKKE